MPSSLVLGALLLGGAPEVRGTWLTTTANTAIATPENSAATMRRLREMGLNTVYTEVWKNGATEFPSDVMEQAVGVPLRVNPSPGVPVQQRDLLEETMIEAHRNGLVYVAWFEYGFMAAWRDTQNELRARRDWISLNQEGGDVAKNGFVWLNPLHPDAQKLLLGIVVEAVRKYDIDGIQLDDRIVWPSLEMGYDEFTQELYAREHGGRRPPKDIQDPEWMAWRQRKVEEFSRRFVREVREAGGPDLLLSLSPGPHPWALENYLIDWPAWSRWTNGPTWDEYVPQVYRMNYPAFEAEWRRQISHMPERRRDLIAGVRLVGDGPDQVREEVAAHARLVRETQGGGHAWWFSRGVLDVFPQEIQGLYDVKRNGHAPHPRFGADWRPAPIALQRGVDGKWRGELPPGRWRLIVKENGRWRTERTLLSVRRRSFEADFPGAEAVELLVRRR